MIYRICLISKWMTHCRHSKKARNTCKCNQKGIYWIGGIWAKPTINNFTNCGLDIETKHVWCWSWQLFREGPCNYLPVSTYWFICWFSNSQSSLKAICLNRMAFIGLAFSVAELVELNSKKNNYLKCLNVKHPLYSEDRHAFVKC